MNTMNDYSKISAENTSSRMATISAEETYFIGDIVKDSDPITEVLKEFEKRHGGAYDRGSADAYYQRAFEPHYYVADSYYSVRVTDLTPPEIAAYKAGFDGEDDRKQYCTSGE